MTNSLDLSSDVIAGATALGGLLLVYLGSVVISFSSYERTAQSVVRGKHQIRAWFAVAAIFLSLLSAGLALIAKWTANSCVAVSAVILFLISLFLVLVASILLATDVK